MICPYCDNNKEIEEVLTPLKAEFKEMKTNDNPKPIPQVVLVTLFTNQEYWICELWQCLRCKQIFTAEYHE